MTVLDPITQAALAIARNTDSALSAQASKVIPVSFGHRVVEGFPIWVSQQTAPSLAASTNTLSGNVTNVANNDTVTIGGKVYTFQTTLTNVDGHVLIAGNLSGSLTNLIHAINGVGGVSGTDYAALTVPSTSVEATDSNGSCVVTQLASVSDPVPCSTTSAVLKWDNDTTVANNTVAGQPVGQLGAPPILAGTTKATFAVSLGYSLLPEADRAGTQILRMWADDVLIYDIKNPNAAPDYMDGMSFTFHPGNPNELPDLTIQADMGVLTPGFRNLIYVVIRDFSLQVGPTPVAPPPVINAPQPITTQATFPFPGLAPDPAVNAFDGGIAWFGPGLGIGSIFLTNPPNPGYPIHGFNGRFISWINDSQSRTGHGGGYDSISGKVTPYPVDIGNGQKVVGGNESVDVTIATTTTQPGTVTQSPPPAPTYRTTLPKITVEIADAIPITPVVENHTVIDTLSPPGGAGADHGRGGFADFDLGYFYQWTNNFASGSDPSSNFVEHVYSMVDQEEIVRFAPQGTYTIRADTPFAFVNYGACVHFDFLAIHDKANKQVFTIEWNNAINGIANTVPLIQIDLQTGQIIGAYGLRGSAIFDVPNESYGFRDCGDCVVGTNVNGNYYAIITGAFLTTSVSATFYAVKGGMTDGGTVQLPGGVSGLFTTGSINTICGYPIVGREDLKAKYALTATATQNWYAFCCLGIYVYLVHGDNVSINPTFELIYTIPDDGNGVEVKDSFIDATDFNLVLIKTANGGATSYIEKLQIVTGLDENGVKPIFKESLYSVQLPAPITGFMTETSLRESRYDNGQMVYPGTIGGVQQWIYIDLGSGQQVSVNSAPHVDGQGYSNWIYDSHTGNAVALGATVNVPAATIELTAGTGSAVQFSDMLTWLMLLVGYDQANISVDANITDQVLGGVIDTRLSVWSYLTNLSIVYGFQYFESEGKIKFAKGTSGDATQAAYTIDVNSLTTADGSTNNLNENVITTLASPLELAGATQVGYIDSEFNYVSNQKTFQRARFPFRPGRPPSTASYETYIVMPGSEALQRAAQAAFANYAEGVVQNLKLPFQFGLLEPGDSLNLIINGTSYLVSLRELVFNPDWSISVTGVNYNYKNNVQIRTDRPLGLTQPNTGPSDSLPVAIESTLPTPADDPGQDSVLLFTGVESLGQPWWNGAALNILDDDTAGQWSKLYFTNKQVNYGRCASLLPPTDTPFRTDTNTQLTVMSVSLTGSGTSTLADADFWAGTNAAYVGQPGRWELIYYETITFQSSKRIVVSTLLRGRRGTEVNCNNHEAGDFFVPFNRSVLQAMTLSVSLINALISYSAVGVGTTKPATVESDTLEGNSLKPWAITYVKAQLQ